MGYSRTFGHISKSKIRFSSVPFDKVHEQENYRIIGSIVVMGLTENLKAFQKWMVSGPEQARLLAEFEEEYWDGEDVELTLYHHEEGFAPQKNFHG